MEFPRFWNLSSCFFFFRSADREAIVEKTARKDNDVVCNDKADFENYVRR
jgi:hypothetical protein